MGGQDGNRGYLIQAVVALLTSLDDPKWQSVSLEPNVSSDKVDIFWKASSHTKATQVKSSINQINKPDATRWATDLKTSTAADSYELVLVGPSSEAVARLGSHDGVAIPCPKNLDIEGLLSEAAHLLDKFLAKEGFGQTSATQREMMVHAIVTKLSAFSTQGRPLTRQQLVSTLKEWLAPTVTSASSTWEEVKFDNQRGLENAVAGHRLGPGDVDACPKLSICNDVIRELERSNLYQIVGQPGCGKSISAWQSAKHFYDKGFRVWRPRSSGDVDKLLSNLPDSEQSLLLVDDAQRFETDTVDRLSELATSKRKVLLVSTVEHASLSTIICVDPDKCVDELAGAFLARRAELLPILQQFDDNLGDRYHQTSIEDRIFVARRQNSAWAFFWFLRGGWQTANKELESVKQFPFAADVLCLIAVGQVVSCDAGVSLVWLIARAKTAQISETQLEQAVERLRQLKLLATSDEIRTKHLQYAFRILEQVFDHANKDLWPKLLSACGEEFSDTGRTLKGVAWLLEAVTRTDMFRLHSQTTLLPVKDELLQRATAETTDIDWAAGCFARVDAAFELSPDETLKYRSLLLEWITSGSGLRARFCGGIISGLINDSGKPPNEGIAKKFNNDVDAQKLVDLANRLTLDDFYSFGWLLNRLAFYGPDWAADFMQKLNWERLKSIILEADADHEYAVDELIYSISHLAETAESGRGLSYVQQINPFIARAINGRPTAMNHMHGIFWQCLGLRPKFLRGGHAPDSDQYQIAKEILDQLEPNAFALAMANAKPRDLENLARAFEMIREIDKSFLRRVAENVPLAEFYSATKKDWETQSDELQSLLLFFALGKEMRPAADWIRANESVVVGPLKTELACVAPDVAVRFHRNGKGVELLSSGRANLNMTAIAILGMSAVDKEACLELVEQEIPHFENALYELSLDPPRWVVRFFRVLHKLSPELYSRLLNLLDLDKPAPMATIKRLVTNQHKERKKYLKLARAGRLFPGKAGDLATGLGERIETAQREHDISVSPSKV